MSEPKLTEQQWRMFLHDISALTATREFFGADGEWRPVEPKHVARYALSLLDRAEKAEAELAEAEDAIREADRIFSAAEDGEPRDAIYRMLRAAKAWRMVQLAVRRALEGGKG